MIYFILEYFGNGTFSDTKNFTDRPIEFPVESLHITIANLFSTLIAFRKRVSRRCKFTPLRSNKYWNVSRLIRNSFFHSSFVTSSSRASHIVSNHNWFYCLIQYLLLPVWKLSIFKKACLALWIKVRRKYLTVNCWKIDSWRLFISFFWCIFFFFCIINTNIKLCLGSIFL